MYFKYGEIFLLNSKVIKYNAVCTESDMIKKVPHPSIIDRNNDTRVFKIVIDINNLKKVSFSSKIYS